MPNHYKAVAGDGATRRLVNTAIIVAALKLKVAPIPPWSLIEAADNGHIVLPKRVDGATWPRPDGIIAILVRNGMTPARTVAVCFHEISHLKSFCIGVARGKAVDYQIAEEAAQAWAKLNAPSGTFAEVMTELLVEGAQICIREDAPLTALLIAERLAPYDAKAAAEFKTRADILIRTTAEIKKLDAGWVAPSERNARQAADYQKFKAEIAANRKRNWVEGATDRALAAARRVKREAATRSRGIPILRPNAAGKLEESGEFFIPPPEAK